MNRKRRELATDLLTKIAPTANDYEEHVNSLIIDDIQVITLIKSNDLDITEEAIPTEMM